MSAPETDQFIEARFEVPQHVEWDHPQGWGLIRGVVTHVHTYPDGYGYTVLKLESSGSIEPRWVRMVEGDLRPQGTRAAWGRAVCRLYAARVVADHEAVVSAVEHLDALLNLIEPRDQGLPSHAALASPVVQDLVLALAPAERGDR